MSGTTPYSKMKAPAQRDHNDPVDRQMTRMEELEEHEAREKKGVREANIDKVAKVLADPFYVTNHRWPFLIETRAGRDVAMTVSQFFPNLKVAVDKFYSEHEFKESADQIRLKRAILNAHGIKYGHLHPARSLAQLQAELEEQGKVKA